VNVLDIKIENAESFLSIAQQQNLYKVNKGI